MFPLIKKKHASLLTRELNLSFMHSDPSTAIISHWLSLLFNEIQIQIQISMVLFMLFFTSYLRFREVEALRKNSIFHSVTVCSRIALCFKLDVFIFIVGFLMWMQTWHSLGLFNSVQLTCCLQLHITFRALLFKEHRLRIQLLYPWF